jgi:hypothetical protein
MWIVDKGDKNITSTGLSSRSSYVVDSPDMR